MVVAWTLLFKDVYSTSLTVDSDFKESLLFVYPFIRFYMC